LSYNEEVDGVIKNVALHIENKFERLVSGLDGIEEYADSIKAAIVKARNALRSDPSPHYGLDIIGIEVGGIRYRANNLSVCLDVIIDASEKLNCLHQSLRILDTLPISRS
jgi:hypothetical protein